MTAPDLQRRMHRRGFLAVGAAGTALALGRLCQSAPVSAAQTPPVSAQQTPSPQAPSPQVAAVQAPREAVVRWLLPAALGAERDLALTLIQTFQQQHPGIVIEASFEPPASYDTALDAALATDTPPDLVQIPARSVQAYGVGGLLLDLGPLMQRDGPARDGFFPFLLDQMSDYRRTSTLWAMPKDIAVSVIFYNRDLFDHALQEYPRPDWTFDDLREVGRRVSFDTLGHRGDGPGYDGSSVRVWAMDWGNHPADSPLPGSDRWQHIAFGQAGPWFSDDLARAYIDDPAHLAFVRKVIDMRCGDQIIPSGPSADDLWLQGRVVMCSAPHTLIYSEELERQPFRYDIAPAPAGPRGQFNAASCNGWAVPARAALPEAAWTFLRFLVAPEQQSLQAQTKRLGTALKSCAASLLPADGQSPGNFKRAIYDPLMGQSAVQTQAIIYPPYLAEMRAVWQAEFGSLFACGAGDLEAAARRAQPQIQALLDKARTA